MLILGIDTATPYLVLGLPTAERAVRLERRHAEVLWSELEDFLRQNSVDRSGLEAIAVGQGPGSYTGLRVGVSAGLGLARGLGVPVVGVSTLHAVGLRYSRRVMVAHTTRNGLCYAATYDGTLEVSPPRKVQLSELEASNGLLSLDEPPSGKAMARLAAAALISGEPKIEPVYL
ncbi:MAG: tRNA (adenosine(37)-N6)-threonylcarbamoyltransferase complex dimerization subunit type 1 TsaB [Meiothermus sp.]|nr:tRNA (adenosine(37)-N6)-threonylcarbamoyltransferase complex dimerization subunit type 1 TsaB [Meiothermus sp.]